jgi:hypothetical protein
LILEAIDKPFGFYRQEMLERVTQFLFSGQPGSCRYLKVNTNTANIWFGEEVHSTEINLKAALNKPVLKSFYLIMAWAYYQSL